MVPFISEDIYQNLVRTVDKNAPESVHLCDFPTVCESMIDKKLEDDMEFILNVVVLGRSARNGANIKNRQPLSEIYVKTDRDVSDYYRDIVEDELNVKKAVFVSDVSAFSSYSFKPQLKTVGPKYGKHLGEIKKTLSELDGNAAMAELEEKGALKFSFGGDDVVLTKDDLLIEVMQKEGYYSVADHGITVALNITLTDALIEEGYVRELISKIQTMRKDAGFDVTDHIMLSVDGNEKLAGVLERNLAAISKSVLADGFDTDGGISKEWDINGENVTITVKKI